MVARKITLLALLLAPYQINGTYYGFDGECAFALVGIAGIGIGVAATLSTWGFIKACKWSYHETGTKKYIGTSVVAGTALGAAYMLGKFSSGKGFTLEIETITKVY